MSLVLWYHFLFHTTRSDFTLSPSYLIISSLELLLLFPQKNENT